MNTFEQQLELIEAQKQLIKLRIKELELLKDTIELNQKKH